MQEDNSRKPQKYADSSISDKAFKHMIILFTFYVFLFCSGVAVWVNLDKF